MVTVLNYMKILFISTLCFNMALPSVDFMDVIIGYIPVIPL